jgi:hypothetical protein
MSGLLPYHVVYPGITGDAPNNGAMDWGLLARGTTTNGGAYPDVAVPSPQHLPPALSSITTEVQSTKQEEAAAGAAVARVSHDTVTSVEIGAGARGGEGPSTLLTINPRLAMRDSGVTQCCGRHDHIWLQLQCC